jgi:hypothetical protein
MGDDLHINKQTNICIANHTHRTINIKLLNSARQIIFALFAYVNSKQHSNHMEDHTLKRILQDKQFHPNIKAEQKEIIQNVLERKDSNE